jgi:hypothetical protein
MVKIFKARASSAYEAITEAQRIAFAPVTFQAVRALRDLGILTTLDEEGMEGLSAASVAEMLGLSEYGVGVLLESGLSAGVVELLDEDRFALSKIGHFLLHDRMTRVNMDFNHFVCYLGLYDLDKAVADSRPAGLRAIDDGHSTFYEALPHLPERIRSTWYAFDHFYSDSAYPAALEIVLSEHPKTLVDVGANLGKFSLLAVQADESLRVTMLDLPDQLSAAVRYVKQSGYGERIDAVAADLREIDSPMPPGRDAYWLSQFLCCFDTREITAILRRIVASMSSRSRLYVLETCWDRQQHEAAAFSLVNTSPYFTCIANGNSKMYTSKELLACIEGSGLRCDRITDGLGACHTLFECSRSIPTE